LLGRRGNFDGVDVIDTSSRSRSRPSTSPASSTAISCATRSTLRSQRKLGRRLLRQRLRIAPFLEMLFMSRDFYAPESVATRIKGPVELVVSTYRKLGLTEVPGVPDFNEPPARSASA
jgi:hypothetical protein